MADFQIVAGSTTDLSAKLVEQTGVCIMPMIFAIDGVEYLNDTNNTALSVRDFYEKVRAGSMPTTAQLNGEAFKEYVTPFLNEGKDVLYLAFSSGLSGTCQAGMLAAEELRETYPERKIIVVDSLNASMGEGLFVYLAAMRAKAGQSIDEVATWAQENRLKVVSWFTVDDLNHLHRGGRVSKTAAVMGSMLNIKPVLHVDDEGHLKPVEKVRGRRASLDALVARVGKSGVDAGDQTVFISHADCEQDAHYVGDAIRKQYGVQTVEYGTIGPVIGAHAGPGTVALFFLAQSRN